MVVESTLTYVLRYPRVGVTIKPGLNFIPEAAGRRLEAHDGFKSLLEAKKGYVTVIQPATKANKAEQDEEKMASAETAQASKKSAVVKPQAPGEVATASLSQEKAIELIGKAIDVESLQDIAAREKRPTVKSAASRRIKKLAQEAESSTKNTPAEEDAGAI